MPAEPLLVVVVAAAAAVGEVVVVFKSQAALVQMTGDDDFLEIELVVGREGDADSGTNTVGIDSAPDDAPIARAR